MGCVCAGKKGAECGQGGGEREKIGFGGSLKKSVELIGVVAGEFEVGVDEWRGMFVQGKMLGVDKVRS